MVNFRSTTAVLIVGTVLVGLGIGVVAAFDVSPAHEHTSHEFSIEDTEYDEQHDIVWSIDNNLSEESVRFVGYDVGAEEIVVNETFSSLSAIAVGDGVVYIVENKQLWEYDVATEEATVLTEMADGVHDMDYDEARDLVWVGQGRGDVVAFDAENGEEVMRHEAHGGEGRVESLSVQGDYVASVLAWDPDVVVYDIENEEVAFEPLPESIEEKEDGNLVSVHVTESEELIIGGGWDTVFMYDIESRELLTRYAAHAFGASEVTYHESEDMIVSTGTGNHVAFYDVESDTVIQRYEHEDTIYAADLDTTNDIIWFGDGEGDKPGTITGLQFTFDESDTTETTTEETTDDSETTTEETTDDSETTTEETTDDSETTTEETTDVTDDAPEETTGGTTPGFGILGAITGLGGVVYLLQRRLTGENRGGE